MMIKNLVGTGDGLPRRFPTHPSSLLHQSSSDRLFDHLGLSRAMARSVSSATCWVIIFDETCWFWLVDGSMMKEGLRGG